ncbi:MAG: pyridoxal-phosphate dependent enzyme [Chloroflexi bacterium]|nr:pyridoxal-phosphate dependent enzyme [Chloroflexota bacterium]
MTIAFELKCLECGARRSPTVRELRCPSCGGLFEIAYHAPPSADAPRLPLTRPEASISLGEGRTPVVELRRTARELGLGTLWAKLEYQAPTGSFKDRGGAVLISAALEDGVDEFVEDSSGNAGASLAAYAAAAGITAHVFVPASAPEGKLGQIRIYGAALHAIVGPRHAATDAAQAFAGRHGIPYLSHNFSPFFAEGMKSFAFEVAASDASAAAHAMFPVGNGSLLVGARKGFDELREAGALPVVPKLHCVQAEAVRPIEAALNSREWSFDTSVRTIAEGISVSRPPRLRQAVAAVRDTGGAAVAVPDDAILAWQRRLARTEGVFCEATAAAAFAGLESLMARGAIPAGADVLVPVTGSGLKEPPPATR